MARLRHQLRRRGRRIAAALLASLATALVATGPTVPVQAAPPSNSKWAIVLCKFADLSADPVATNGLTTNGTTTLGATINRSWLSTFFTESGKGQGGIFDYWANISYGQESLSGTTLFPTTGYTNDDWYQLALQPSGRGAQEWYTSQPGQARFLVWPDCVNTAVSQGANFTGFYGVLVVTNGYHDDSALGLGQACSVPTPNNGSQVPVACVVINFHNLYVSTTAHEMGHGFGLPHSRDTFDCNPPSADYCDKYDLMTDSSNTSSVGPLGVTSDQFKVARTGPGLNAPNLDSLGWLPSNRKCQYAPGQWQRFSLAPLETGSDPGCLMVKVPLTNNTYYTIEYRHSRGQDAALNDDIVLIHLVGSDGLSYLVDSGYLFNTKVKLNAEWQPTQEYWDGANNVVIKITRTAEEATVDLRPAKATPPQLPSNWRFGLTGVSTNVGPGFIDYSWNSSYNPDHFELLVSGIFTNAYTNAQTNLGSNLFEVPGYQRMFELQDQAVGYSTTWTFQVQACMSGDVCSGFTPPISTNFPAAGGGGSGGGSTGGLKPSNWYTAQ